MRDLSKERMAMFDAIKMHDDWRVLLKEEFDKEYWNRIWTYVRADQNVLCPAPSKIFRVLETPPKDIKAVILGQDPYPERAHAAGLAFSSPKMTKSLKNIFAEIARTERRIRHNPILTDWKDQGVFLLNANLTTTQGKPLAHQHLQWPNFTLKLLEIIKKLDQPIVHMLWGNHAQELFLKNHQLTHQKHMVKIWSHPAARTVPFTGNNHFKSANEWLNKFGVASIDWAGADATNVQK